VREHDAMTDEHAVFERDPFADEAVTRDLAETANDRSALDFDECADPRSFTDVTAVEIDEVGMMNDDVRPQHDACRNHWATILSVMVQARSAGVAAPVCAIHSCSRYTRPSSCRSEMIENGYARSCR